MSIVALLLVNLIAHLNQPPRDATTVCVTDARTRAPLIGVMLTVRPTRATGRVLPVAARNTHRCKQPRRCRRRRRRVTCAGGLKGRPADNIGNQVSH